MIEIDENDIPSIEEMRHSAEIMRRWEKMRDRFEEDIKDLIQFAGGHDKLKIENLDLKGGIDLALNFNP